MPEGPVISRVGRLSIARDGHSVEIRLGRCKVSVARQLRLWGAMLGAVAVFFFAECYLRGGWRLLLLPLSFGCLVLLGTCLVRALADNPHFSGRVLRASPAGVEVTSAFGKRGLTAGEVADIEVRRPPGLWRRWYAASHGELPTGPRGALLFTGTEREMKAVGDAVRSCLGLPEDPFRRSWYGKLARVGWAMHRWNVTPQFRGAAIRRSPGARERFELFVWCCGALLFVQLWPPLPYWLPFPGIFRMLAIGLISLPFFAAGRFLFPEIHIWLTADGLRVSRRRFRKWTSWDVAIEPQGFAVEGRKLMVADDQMKWHLVIKAESGGMARWACQALEVGLESRRHPRMVPADFKNGIVEASAVAVPMHWNDAEKIVVSRGWGGRYCALLERWGDMGGEDRAWWRRYVEGLPYFRPRKAAPVPVDAGRDSKADVRKTPAEGAEVWW